MTMKQELEELRSLIASKKMDEAKQLLWRCLIAHPGQEDQFFEVAGTPENVRGAALEKLKEARKTQAPTNKTKTESQPTDRSATEARDVRPQNPTPKSPNANAKSSPKKNNPLARRTLAENYAGRRYCEDAMTLGVAGIDGGKCASGKNLHPNCLPYPISVPVKSWTVLIDETGQSNDSSNKTLRVAAVFVPDNVTLQPFKNHACEGALGKEEHAARYLLDSRCRILGVSVDSLNAVRGDRWLYAIETIMDLAVRLIQSSTGKVAFNVKVEQKGGYDVQRAQPVMTYVCNNVLARYARAFPELAKKIEITGSFMSKDDPLNGYPDAVAHVWGSKKTRSLLEFTGWRDACLIDGNITGQDLRYAFDLIERENRLDAESWQKLLVSPDSKRVNSLIYSILNKLGTQIQKNGSLWREYLNFTIRYAESKFVDIDALTAQIEWLKQYRPDQKEFSKKIQLLVRVCHTLAKGLRGDAMTTKSDEYSDFRELADSLYEENATLVCNAELHLAETFVNSFDLFKIKKILARWIAPDLNVAIPGLRGMGRVWTCIGESEAFLRNFDDAVESFKKAEGYFKRLCDPDECDEEMDSLWASRAVAMMDADLELFEQNVGTLFDAPLDEIAKQLAGSADREDDYQHYVFVRYVGSCQTPLADKARKVYLSRRNEWKTPAMRRRPWDLIEFYRALMLDGNVGEQKKRFKKALVAVGAPTNLVMKLRAAIYMAALWQLETEPQAKASRLDKYRKLVEKIKNDDMPSSKFSPANWELLAKQPDKPRPILDLARQILPYLFR